MTSVYKKHNNILNYMKYFKILLYLLLLSFSNGFINSFTSNSILTTSLKSINCNERKLYGSYLLGLRKTRKLISSSYNSTKINELINIVNFTNQFIENYTIINNTETKAKTITMQNIVIDVSNIKYIEISSVNDKLTIELDTHSTANNLKSISNNVNNIETIINLISFLGKISSLT